METHVAVVASPGVLAPARTRPVIGHELKRDSPRGQT